MSKFNLPPIEELFQEEFMERERAIKEIDTLFLHTGNFPSSCDEMSNGWRMIDCGSFDEFIECSVPIYCEIARQCKEQGITHVYDIGSCTAWQGRIFAAAGIDYTGIEVDPHDKSLMPKQDGIRMVNRAYPFSIETKDRAHTAVISNLCVGYSLLEGNPTKRQDFTRKMYEQIAKDFDYFIGNIGPDERNYFQSRFGVLEKDVEGRCTVWGNRQRFNEFKDEKIRGDAMNKTISYEEELLAIMDKNAEIQQNVKNELQGYANRFRSYGIDISYVTADMAPYPNVMVKDRESGETAEVRDVKGKEDFIKKFPKAVTILKEYIVKQQEDFALADMDAYEYAREIKGRLAKAFREITKPDRESLFVFSVEAGVDSPALAKHTTDALLDKDSKQALNTKLDIYESFIDDGKFEFGNRWESVRQKDAPVSLDNAAVQAFQNQFTGEQISFIMKNEKDGTASMTVAGKISDGTAQELDTYLKYGMKKIGFSMDDFKEKWGREAVPERDIRKPSGKLRVRFEKEEKINERDM